MLDSNDNNNRTSRLVVRRWPGRTQRSRFAWYSERVELQPLQVQGGCCYIQMINNCAECDGDTLIGTHPRDIHCSRRQCRRLTHW